MLQMSLLAAAAAAAAWHVERLEGNALATAVANTRLMHAGM